MNLFSWHPAWIAVVILVSFLYLRKEGTSPTKKTYFLSGLILFYAAVGTPFNSIAIHGLFTAYMIQLSILYFVVPPLLICGIPAEWMRPALRKGGLKKAFQILTYPWLTAITFNVGFSVFLFPFIFNGLHAHLVVLGICEGLLFLSALTMWWSILSPLPELNPLSQLKRIFYIFVTAIMLTPIAFLLLFANHVLYPAYANTPAAFPYLNAIYDQQIAGGVMKGFQLT
ncbi:MAG TPA: cytochrome c oxidase assembly protein, partial [Bacillales bacterium]|nr:cytochrome c oxidase assembly protein [Bacillales bacterium]